MKSEIVVSKNDHIRLHMWIDNGANIYESYIRNGFNSVNPKLNQIWFNMVTLSQASHDLVMKVQRLHGVGSVLRNT